MHATWLLTQSTWLNICHCELVQSTRRPGQAVYPSAACRSLAKDSSTSHTASAILFTVEPDQISTSNIPVSVNGQHPSVYWKFQETCHTLAPPFSFISCPQHDKLIRSRMPAHIANGMNRKPSACRRIGKQAIIAKKHGLRRSSPSSFLVAAAAAAAASDSQLAPRFSSSACPVVCCILGRCSAARFRRNRIRLRVVSKLILQQLDATQCSLLRVHWCLLQEKSWKTTGVVRGSYTGGASAPQSYDTKQICSVCG